MYNSKDQFNKQSLNILLHAIYRNSGCVQFVYNEMNSKVFVNSAPSLQVYTHDSKNKLLYDWNKRGFCTGYS